MSNYNNFRNDTGAGRDAQTLDDRGIGGIIITPIEVSSKGKNRCKMFILLILRLSN